MYVHDNDWNDNATKFRASISYVCIYVEFMTRHMSQAIRLRGKNTSQLTVGNTEKNASLIVF